MPVTILINASHAESLINFRGDLIKFLISEGHAVHACAPEMSKKIAAELRELGSVPYDTSLDRAGQNPAKDARYLIEMIRLLRQVRPNLVLNYTIKPNIWGSFAARFLGIPTYSMVTGVGFVMLQGNGIKRKVVQSIARNLYRAALSKNRAVIFQNNDDVAAFLQAGIVRKEQVRLVRGSGVNLDRFRPEPLPHEPVFLMIARLLRTKGVGEYAEAARLLKKSVRNARCLLIGPPDPGPDGLTEPDIADLSNGAVEYLGPQADVRPFIARASIYVLPSYREGTPRSVLEAMAMARPIITTDAPGCRETVTQGRNGLLVPIGDANALAYAMQKLAQDPSLRIAMGKCSRTMAAETFDVNGVNRDMLQHLELSS